MTTRISSYRDLEVWQLARRLVGDVYRLTSGFPDSERFGLAQQLRRAAVSVPSNIAEGYGRGSTSDYIRFLKMARGSLYEVETQLLLAQDLGFLQNGIVTKHLELHNQCCRMLHGLIKSLS